MLDGGMEWEEDGTAGTYTLLPTMCLLPRGIEPFRSFSSQSMALVICQKRKL